MTKEQRNNYQRAWRAKNPDKLKRYNKSRDHRRYDLKRLYGITPEEYDRLLIQQNGVCAICQQPPNDKRLVVDHDHNTKKVRGLLHDLCNQFIGLAKEDVAVLKASVHYLEKHKAHLA